MFSCRFVSRSFFQRASLRAHGNSRTISSDTKIGKLCVESALVNISTPKLGLEFVKQLLILPKPPVHLFAVSKEKEVLQAVEKLREFSSGATYLYVVKRDMTEKEDLISLTELVQSCVQDRGLSLLVDNPEILLPNISPLSTDDMLDFFLHQGYGPVQVTEAFVPLLERAARRPEFDGFKMSASRASVLNIPFFSPMNRKIDYIHNWNSSLGQWTDMMSATVGMLHVLDIVREKNIFVVQFDPEWEKKDLANSLEKLDLSGYVFDMLNALAECEPKVHGCCINRHGKILLYRNFMNRD